MVVIGTTVSRVMGKLQATCSRSQEETMYNGICVYVGGGLRRYPDGLCHNPTNGLVGTSYVVFSEA